MNKIGIYIYGIINSNTSFRLYVTKNSSDVEGVYTVPYQDISAVVSEGKIIDYTYILKETTAKELVKHQQVIERIMKLDHTITPMRLGTFAVDEDEVRHILIKGYPVIKDILSRIHDKIEIDVASTWSDFNSILKELSEEKEIRELRQTLLSKKAGVAVDDQMKIGMLVKKYLDKRREEFSNEIQAFLKSFTQDFKTHGLMDDKMVLNTAYLLDKSRKEDFEKGIEELNIKFSEKLNFRCIGPLPPYSFYTLEVKKMRFEEIDRARKRLGLLNGFVTKDEIRDAHKSAAIATHPDKNPDKPGIEREFDETTKAYKLLCEYCQGDSCSFDEEEFRKDALLVKVRG